MKLPKTVKYDTDPLEAGNYFFTAVGDVPPCIAGPSKDTLKRHLEDLVQCGYLDEYILDLEEDPKAGETPAETVD